MGNPFDSLISGIFDTGNTVATNAANYAATVATNDTNKEIAKEANDLQVSENTKTRSFNAQQAEVAYQRELNKMRLQHQYNSPVELVKQMREAGLNPSFASGMSGAGQVSSASAPMASSGASINPVIPQMISPRFAPFPNIVGNAAQVAQIASQIKKTEAETKYQNSTNSFADSILREQLKSMQTENDLKTFSFGLQQRFGASKASAELQSMLQSIFLAKKEGVLKDVETTIKRYESLYQKELVRTAHYNADKARVEASLQGDILRANIRNTEASTAAQYAGAQASRSSAKYYDAKAMETEIDAIVKKDNNEIINSLSGNTQAIYDFFTLRQDEGFWHDLKEFKKKNNNPSDILKFAFKYARDNHILSNLLEYALRNGIKFSLKL